MDRAKQKNNGWPIVALGDVMIESRQPHVVQRDQSYPNFGIYSFGRGVFPKPPIDGMATSASTLYRACAGQFVYSRLFAFEGAYGVVPAELDGFFVSNEFPLFDCKPDRLLPEYLRRYLSVRHAWEAIATASTGMGHRRQRVQPEQFLKFAIPLPPIEEQQRIVARIEALAARVGEARGLRAECGKSSDSVYASARDELFAGLKCSRRAIGDSFDLLNGRAFKPDEWESVGRKIVRIQNLKYPEAQYNFFSGHVDCKHIVRDGDVLFAWSGQVVSLGAHIWRGEDAILNQHIFNVRARAEMLPEFVKEGFNALVDEMKGQVRGLEMFHIRKREVDALLFPMATVTEQRRIVAYLDGLSAKVESLKSLQRQSAAELDALLPSILDKAFRGELLATNSTISVPASPPAQPRKHFSDLADLVVHAYFDVRDGWSTEYLLSSPDLSRRFIDRCAALGAQRTPRDLLAALINARRAGALKGSEKARKFSIQRDQMDLFSFASEMAFRCIQDRLQAEQQRDLTVDAMLTNPAIAEEFDQFAARLAPGYGPLQFRWTTITLRKERRFCDARKPMPLFEDLGRADDVRVAKLADNEGVYWATVEGKPLFVAVADNLRAQIDRLLEGTKKRITPEWMADEIVGMPCLHVLSMPKCTVVEREIMRARVLREDFARLNFLGGPLFVTARPGR